MTNNPVTGRYCGIVFKQGPDTADFSCSKRIVLPGQPSQRAAWAAVGAAMRADPSCIGGEVQPFCGKRCGSGCGKPLLNL
jgi:hypothetical protein